MVEAVWPGDSIEAQLKRLAAMHLMHVNTSRWGPHSMTLTEVGFLFKAEAGHIFQGLPQRNAVGGSKLPRLKLLLQEDPYFRLTQRDAATLIVQLNEDLLSAELRSLGGDPSPTNMHNSYPVRPGVADCEYFLKWGFCSFKGNCRFNHPPAAVARAQKKQQELRAARAAAAVDSGADSEASELGNNGSSLGVGGGADDSTTPLPVRPGVPDCFFFQKHGWCKYRGECWFNHPPKYARTPGAGKPGGGAKLTAAQQRYYQQQQQQQAAGSDANSNGNGQLSPEPSRASLNDFIYEEHLDEEAVDESSAVYTATAVAGSGDSMSSAVVELILDAVWPATLSKETFLRSHLARYMLRVAQTDGKLDVMAVDEDTATETVILLSSAGIFLRDFWRRQGRYDPNEQPYSSLKSLLEDDPYLQVTVGKVKSVPSVVLKISELIGDGVKMIQQQIPLMIDAIYPPKQSKEAFLRGALAKKVVQTAHANAKNTSGIVLLSEPTMMLMSQAGQYLLELWKTQRLYNNKEPPYKAVRDVIADDGYLKVIVSPANRSVHCIQLDVAAIIRNGTKVMLQQARAGPDKTPQPPAAAPAPASVPQASKVVKKIPSQASIEAPPAAAGGSRMVTPEPQLPPEAQPQQQQQQQQPPPPPQQQQQQQEQPPTGEGQIAAPARWGGPTTAGSAAAVLSHADWGWMSLSVQVIDRPGQHFMDMVQHLQNVRLIAVACVLGRSDDGGSSSSNAAAGRDVVLLQLCAPEARAGYQSWPATAYLVDVADPVRGAQLVPWFASALESDRILKVVHEAATLTAALQRQFNVKVAPVCDIGFALGMLYLLRHVKEAPHQAFVKSRISVSIKGLLHAYGFHHPAVDTGDLDASKWLSRPLPRSAIEWGAAEVCYLLPIIHQVLIELKDNDQMKVVTGALGALEQEAAGGGPGAAAAAKGLAELGILRDVAFALHLLVFKDRHTVPEARLVRAVVEYVREA